MVHRNRVQGPGLRVRTRWVYFAFIGGVSAFAGALQFGLQLGECGRRSFGEADQLTRVPIDLRDLGGAEFGEQGGANRGRGCGIAVTDVGGRRESFPSFMYGEVEHPGAVEHGDLDELAPQHLGILANPVELADLVESIQECSAQFDGSAAEEVAAAGAAHESTFLQGDAQVGHRGLRYAEFTGDLRQCPDFLGASASRSRMRTARVTAGAFPDAWSGPMSILFSSSPWSVRWW